MTQAPRPRVRRRGRVKLYGPPPPHTVCVTGTSRGLGVPPCLVSEEECG